MHGLVARNQARIEATCGTVGYSSIIIILLHTDAALVLTSNT